MKPIQVIIAFAMLTTIPVLAKALCEQNDDSITITRNGFHVLTYNKTVKVPPGVDSKYGRSGFIHPITTPSGRIITDDYPLPHHSHQHGLFFAWKKATLESENLNFWEPGNATVRHEKTLDIMNEKHFAGFRVELAHVKGSQKILREIWIVKAYSDTGYIDLITEQSCVTDSPLTLERFHYGGMAIRGSRQWFKDSLTSTGKGTLKNGFVELTKMITNEGLTQTDGNHSRPKWVCMWGAIDTTPVSITFIPHPTNFRHPQHVRLHPEMPYFCFIPTVDKAFTMEPGQRFNSRYRIVAEDGEPDIGKLNAIQKTFAQEK